MPDLDDPFLDFCLMVAVFVYGALMVALVVCLVAVALPCVFVFASVVHLARAGTAIWNKVSAFLPG